MLQDIADLAFRSSQGRPVVSLSISVMIADTVISIVVESIFLIQVSKPSISQCCGAEIIYFRLRLRLHLRPLLRLRLQLGLQLSHILSLKTVL